MVGVPTAAGSGAAAAGAGCGDCASDGDEVYRAKKVSMSARVIPRSRSKGEETVEASGEAETCGAAVIDLATDSVVAEPAKPYDPST